jgi:hypothetical protein
VAGCNSLLDISSIEGDGVHQRLIDFQKNEVTNLLTLDIPNLPDMHAELSEDGVHL